MSSKSLEVQTLGNRWFNYPAGAFLQVILFFRLDKRDGRRGLAPRAAERGDNLQRLPALKVAGEAGYDLLLPNPSQPRLHNLLQVGRFGPVACVSEKMIQVNEREVAVARDGAVQLQAHIQVRRSRRLRRFRRVLRRGPAGADRALVAAAFDKQAPAIGMIENACVGAVE